MGNALIALATMGTVAIVFVVRRALQTLRRPFCRNGKVPTQEHPSAEPE